MSNVVPGTDDTGEIDFSSPDEHPEVRYIAFVQLYGLIVFGEKSPIESRAFTYYMDAIRWVRETVENAHGELALVIPSFIPIAYDFGGQPVRFQRCVWTVVTSGGPVWGMVVDIGESTPDEFAVVHPIR